MKTFKKIDWIMQLVMISLAVLLSVRFKANFLGETFMYSYILVGSWQLISVLIHFFFPPAAKSRARKIYLILLCVSVATGVVIGITNESNLIGFMYVMLFWTPLLALLYLGTCIYESRMLEKSESAIQA